MLFSFTCCHKYKNVLNLKTYFMNHHVLMLRSISGLDISRWKRQLQKEFDSAAMDNIYQNLRSLKYCKGPKLTRDFNLLIAIHCANDEIGAAETLLGDMKKIRAAASPNFLTYAIFCTKFYSTNQSKKLDEYYASAVLMGVFNHRPLMEFSNINIVDMHGFSVGMAVAAIRFILHDAIKLMNFGQSIPSHSTLGIITGVGNGSVASAVRRTLLQLNPPIRYVQNTRNTGQIFINRSDLHRWCSSQIVLKLPWHV